ncbi:hypothetical protein MFIFM68171_07140 [Madurella fahalii]|uniref:Uncharacterized protein n=1 Tax=Madurella fahalii TaxID=1157608 RepID=A0ABQ0GGW8_9PEZI
MSPKLSKIQRAELENVIVNKLQGVEDVTDKGIARTSQQAMTEFLRRKGATAKVSQYTIGRELEGVDGPRRYHETSPKNKAKTYVTTTSSDGPITHRNR